MHILPMKSRFTRTVVGDTVRFDVTPTQFSRGVQRFMTLLWASLTVIPLLLIDSRYPILYLIPLFFGIRLLFWVRTVRRTNRISAPHQITITADRLTDVQVIGSKAVERVFESHDIADIFSQTRESQGSPRASTTTVFGGAGVAGIGMAAGAAAIHGTVSGMLDANRAVRHAANAYAIRISGNGVMIRRKSDSTRHILVDGLANETADDLCQAIYEAFHEVSIPAAAAAE